MQKTGRQGESAEEAVLRLVQEHAGELLRFARRFSYCADDAHDAYQRSIEILVKRMRTAPPEQPLSWLRTVLRHEAFGVRAQREQLVGRAEVDLDRHEDRQLEDLAERAVGHERLRHTAEALQRLKPQEVTALVLRAEGLSYKEICRQTGWTYTRCNRAITEGRRALLDRLGAIESGDECARWLPLLSALADGEAKAADLAELRPHLRACPACRATLRGFHAAPAQVAALVPAALLPLAADPSGSLFGHVELALHGLAERTTLLALRVQGAFEAVPGAKLAAVAASTAAIAGGGAAIKQVAREPRAAQVSARVIGVPASQATAPRRLMTAALPLPQPARDIGRSRDGGHARQREFASSPPPTSEFASAAPTVPAAVPAAIASARPAASGEPQFSSRSEFAGP